MSDSQKEQIFEYIFGDKEVPAHIMNEFFRWLVEHEGDRETEEMMLAKWEEYSKTLFADDDLKGLKSVRRRIRSAEKERKSPGKAALAIITGCLLFLAGGALSAVLNRPVKEITLVTAEGNLGEFRLPDGTKVWLNENTSLTYPETFNGGTRAVTLNGEAFFEVRKDPEKPFSVSTPSLTVSVHGTSFGVSCYRNDKKEEVVLKSGSVSVAGRNLPEVIVLNPDEMLEYSPFDGNMSVKAIDVEHAYRWYEKYLAFDNARFSDILANISHRYNMDISVLTSVSPDKRLSLTIIHEPVETTMDIISTLLPIRYEIHGNSMIIRDKYNN